MATKRISDKNTKTEILDAYEQLLQDKRELEKQLNLGLVQESPKASIGNAKVEAIAPPPSPLPTLKPPSIPTISAVIESLNQIQGYFGGAISGLSEKLISKATDLQDLQTSLAEEIEQLQTLHDLDFATTDLDDLIQHYGDTFKELSDRFSEHQATLDQELADTKLAWEKEQEDHRRQLKDRNETLGKLTQRDSKEYAYGLTLQRQIVTEAFEQEQQQRYQELADRKAEQEKQWNERETAIAAQEKEFLDLKTQVEGLEAELEAAVKKAKEEGRGIAYHQAKVRSDLATKDFEAQERTAQLRIAALQDTITAQDSRIQTLTQQLNNALKQVQDLAVKAIDGAANASSLQAMKEIAMEQAKGQNKPK